MGDISNNMRHKGAGEGTGFKVFVLFIIIALTHTHTGIKGVLDIPHTLC